MNIMDLKNAVDLALERGIDPNCTVVLGLGDVSQTLEWAILDMIEDPSNPDNTYEGVIWFTLFPGEEADGRFTPCHWPADA